MASTTTEHSDQRGGHVRLFVALSLPRAARDVLADWQRSVLTSSPELRGVDSTTLHATLCFLGRRGVEEVELIAAACRSVAGSGAARLALAGALWLPRRRPGVLAVGLDDLDGALAPTQAALSAALAGAGVYRPESRPFLAHVTVARVRHRERLRGRELAPPPPSLTFEADTITLYRSDLTPAGASYEALATVSTR